ncbi:hypothetical protein CFIO01_12691 [Colletotrichum fioriniae PJ7]|uniref:Uncharacterized protein n=1 Tax=Colletotrichum fioriniae PJ7 TaxID=1445577 RepID=A0A010S187_9PEZI|nr:hypothetical protein CFIO01_12691 [Colletotrichum fioriniae PJ7]
MEFEVSMEYSYPPALSLLSTHYLPCSTTSSTTTPSAERTNRGTWDGSRNRNITERAKTCLLGNPLRPEIHSTTRPQDQATTPPVNYTCTDTSYGVGTLLHTARPRGGSRARLRMAAMGRRPYILAHERAPATIQDQSPHKLPDSTKPRWKGTNTPYGVRTMTLPLRRRSSPPLFHSLSPGDTWEERNLTTWDGWDKTGESHLCRSYVRAHCTQLDTCSG